MNLTRWATVVAATFALSACAGGLDSEDRPSPSALEATASDTLAGEGAVGTVHEAVTSHPILMAYSHTTALTASTGNLYFADYVIDLLGVSTANLYRIGKNSPPDSQISIDSEPMGDNSLRFGSPTYASVGGTYYAYFVANYDHHGAKTSQIKRVPLAGGYGSFVANSPGYVGLARDLATNGTDLAWADEEGVRRVPITGGEVRTLATTTTASKVNVVGGDAYYTDGPFVYRIRLVTGAKSALVVGDSNVTAMYIDSATSRVFWGEASGAVRSKPLAGGATTTYQAPTTGLSADFVGFDGLRTLWVDCNHLTGACSVTKREGLATKVITSNVDITALQWDATSVFWNLRYGGVYKYVH